MARALSHPIPLGSAHLSRICGTKQMGKTNTEMGNITVARSVHIYDIYIKLIVFHENLTQLCPELAIFTHLAN